MPYKKEKWLEFHDGQCQFIAPFMLYANFESILKLADQWYWEKTNQMKIEKQDKASCTEIINKHVSSGWWVHSTFNVDVPQSDPMKIYRSKGCLETF